MKILTKKNTHMKNLKLLMLVVSTFIVGQINAQPSCLTEEELYFFNEHEDEISLHAKYLCDDCLAAILARYRFDKNNFYELQSYCHDKELKKYVHNYIETNPALRIVAKESIDSIYSDSINKLLIPYNPELTGHTISLTLRLAKALKLKDLESDFLMAKALDFSRRIRHDPTASFAREEMDALGKVLKRKEIENVINEKNNTVCEQKALRVWNILEENDLSNLLDSIVDVRFAQRYYKHEMFIQEYFVDQDDVLARNLAELYKAKPEIIKMYESINERNRIQSKKQNGKIIEAAW